MVSLTECNVEVNRSVLVQPANTSANIAIVWVMDETLVLCAYDGAAKALRHDRGDIAALGRGLSSNAGLVEIVDTVAE